MSNRKLTKAQALRALDWAKGHFGLQAWNIDLYWTDDVPDWADHREYARKHYGCADYQVKCRTGKIWCAIKNCDRNGIDRLQNLMHEMVHIFFAYVDMDKAVSFDADEEFTVNRFADTLAFAYLHKMKPWRKCK